MPTQPKPPTYYPIGFVGPQDEVIVAEAWQAWFTLWASERDRAFSGTIPLAKLTGGGADGSLTITNGLITQAVAPT